jgi:transcriptional regulator with XRE-family HTH domain
MGGLKMAVGDNIKKARLKAGLTQQELAGKLGLSHQAIGGWESGYREPRLSQIGEIASLFGVTIDSLANAAPDTASASEPAPVSLRDDAQDECGEAAIGENIKNARLKAGMTQQDLASVIDVKRQTISAYENGVHAPRVKELPAMASALNVSVDYLLTGRPALRNAPIDPISAKLGMLGEKRKAAVEAVIDGFLDSLNGNKNKPG